MKSQNQNESEKTVSSALPGKDDQVAYLYTYNPDGGYSKQVVDAGTVTG
jgi:hypothetical protein